jgi:glycosyltransferase involved in cell wall biosynthesis
MAEAIVRLLKDEGLRRRMGDAGRARAESLFSAERMVQKTLTVYQRVALQPHREG